MRARLLALLRLPWPRALAAAPLFAAALSLARAGGWLEPLELSALDALTRHAATPVPSEDVVLVAVTEQDIQRLGYPVRDRDLAAVIRRVADAGPRAIGVDLYRDIGVAPGEEELEAAIREVPNLLWVWKLPDAGNAGVPPPPLLRGTDSAVLADTVTDAGGTLRRGLLLAEDARTGRNVRTLGTALAERHLGQRLRPGGEGGLSLGGHRIALVEPPWGPFATVDGSGYQVVLDWRGGQVPFPLISFQEALESPDLAARVGGRSVIVGVAALSVKDIFATPFTTGSDGVEPMPGLVAHAHLAAQIIRAGRGEPAGRVPLPREGDAAIVLAMALGGALVALGAGGVAAGAPGVLLGVALAGGAGYLGLGAGLLLPVVPAALAWVGSAAIGIWLLHGAGRRERERLQRTFEHYLDPRIIAEMAKSGEMPGFGGERRTITAIFTDVAGFTTFSEQMDAAEVADLLNAYFDRMSAVVMEHGGLVNDFIGDALVALFGVPHRQEDHPDRAVSAALALDAVGQAFSAECQARGIAFGVTRIGVHTGVALVGNMGTRTRLKYTALGDTMNTAARVEGINKYFGTRVCVTGATATLAARHRFRPIGDVVVKGRSGLLPILVPLRADEAQDAPYARAMAALRDDAAGAREMFAALSAERPDDPLPAFHLRRLSEGGEGTTIVMSEK